MARRPGDKPLSEPMPTQFTDAYICGTGMSYWVSYRYLNWYWPAITWLNRVIDIKKKLYPISIVSFNKMLLKSSGVATYSSMEIWFNFAELNISVLDGGTRRRCILVFLILIFCRETRINHVMMASSNGILFRVTGHWCGEFTGPRWIPHPKASDAELWCFLWSVWE